MGLPAGLPRVDAAVYRSARGPAAGEEPPVRRQLARSGRPGRQPRRRPARRTARLDSSTPAITAPTTAAMPATDFSAASGSEAGGTGSTVTTGGLLRVPSTAVSARYGLTTP